MTYNGNARAWLPYLFIALFLFLLFPAAFYLTPMKGIDPSYNIALQLAYKYHLVFGKDLVFTLGPLGILDSRMPISVSLSVYLLFDLYFLGTIFIILKDLFKRQFSPAVVLFILLGILVSPNDATFQRYFLFFLYFLLSFIREPRKNMYLIQSALLSILCFYYKVNVGVVAVSLFLIATVYVLMRKRLRPAAGAVMLLSYFIILLGAGYFLHVDIRGYIAGSFQIIGGYTDAMSYTLGDDHEPYVVAAVFILGAIFGLGAWQLFSSVYKKKMIRHADPIFIAGILAVASFFIFKCAFVRADQMHMPYFFNMAWSLTGLLYLFLSPGWERKIAAWCGWATLIVCYCALNELSDGGRHYLSVVKPGLLPAKVRQIGVYFRQLAHYNKALAVSHELDTAHNELKGIIGDHTVDIIPIEISRIYFNGLRYDPRPVIQSYSAYNSYLDSLNERKYLSASAPDYILFSLAGIDQRQAFFDESRTKLAIFGRYTIAGKVGGDLLLRKKPLPGDLQRSKEEIVRARLGEDIPIPAGDGLLFARIIVHYSLSGRIKRFFYQAPPLTITLTLADGGTMSYEISPDMLEDGVIINKFVQTEDDFRLLARSGGRLGNAISGIRIDRLPGFARDIEIRTSRYLFPDRPQPERLADSLDLAKFIGEINNHKPVLIDTSLFEKDSIHSWVESMETFSPLIRIKGWAYRENADNHHTVVRAALRVGDSLYALPSIPDTRHDLVSHFKRNDVLGNGFTAQVSKSQLMPGNYRVELIIDDTVRRKSWIGPTDQEIRITK
jgi:hypothetical protein